MTCVELSINVCLLVGDRMTGVTILCRMPESRIKCGSGKKARKWGDNSQGFIAGV